MGPPVWLLDVDGVINVGRPGWGAAPRGGEVYSGGLALRMRWAPGLITRVRALHRGGRVEIVWCSTWCHDADQVEQLFGLQPLGRAWFDERAGSAVAAAKLAAARGVLARGRRLIWTDDSETPTSGPVYEELTAHGRALLIAPLPNRGLQPEHMDAIEAFVAAAADDTDAGMDALVARRLLGGDRATSP